VPPLYAAEPAPAPAPSRWAGFAPSSPLFLAATALFIGGYAVWRFNPTVGPGSFPLWDLLVVLGFVSAIGGVVSWFFASGDGSVAEGERPVPSPSARYPPAKPRPRIPATPVAATEYGRPRPDVRLRSRSPGHASGSPGPLTTAPFRDPMEERSDEEEGPPGPLPTPAAAPSPRPEVEEMLQELDGIERDASPRRPAAPASTY